MKLTFGWLWAITRRLSEIIVHGAHFSLINVHGHLNIIIHIIRRQTIDDRLEKMLQILSGNNTYLQDVTIVELQHMAKKEGFGERRRKVVCDSLCRFLSCHPSCYVAINALFRKDSPFLTMKKEINGANFSDLKLGHSFIIENVKFLDCTFNGCGFHKIDFLCCDVKGGEICGCDFKDDIKWRNCHLNNVQMNNLYFRHNYFYSIAIRAGEFHSSSIIRSELCDVSFYNTNLDNIYFGTCKFLREGFIQCQMNNVKYRFDNSEEKSLLDMQEALIHQGYQLCVERNSMILVVA